MANRDEVFAACDRLALKTGVAGVSHRAVLKELGRGSFSLGPFIEDWKNDKKRTDDLPPFLAEAAQRLVEQLWRLVKDSAGIENQSSRQSNPRKKTRSHGVVTITPGSRRFMAKEIRDLAAKRAEQVLTESNRPMRAIELHERLPPDLKKRIPENKMFRVLAIAKNSSRLIQLRDQFKVNSSKWWIADLALPEEFLRPRTKTYKRKETELALTRRNHGDLIKSAITILVEAGEPLHFDVICQKLKVSNEVKADFQRSLYRRSIYSKQYKRIRSDTYQAILNAVGRR
jgi:hypothetical protein